MPFYIYFWIHAMFDTPFGSLLLTRVVLFIEKHT